MEKEWHNFFIWQYESRKRWILFPKEDNDILNSSLQTSEICVSLHKKNQIIINLERMIQVNVKSGYEQRIRCVIYNSGFYVWLWQNEKNKEWVCYHPFIVIALELSFQRKKKDLEVLFLKNKILKMNLESYEEHDSEAHISRSIMRDSIDLICTTETENFVQQSSAYFSYMKSLNTDLSIPKMKITPEIDMKTLNSVENNGNVTLVDAECPSKKGFHIYSQADVIYTATLNLASLQNNNNKFYIIQLLEDNKKKSYSVWRRWGRVGVRGQCELNSYGTNLTEAKTVFEKKFYDKTKNNWTNVSMFTQCPGKYDLLLMDNTNNDHLCPEVKQKESILSTLPFKIQTLLELIFDKKEMEDNMKEMSYDADKTPLGKLTSKQVKEGYIALNKIICALNHGKKTRELLDACNEFYTKIPHNFGMKTPPIIKTKTEIENKIKMLEALSNIAVAMNVLNLPQGIQDEHTLDRYYKSLECELNALDKTNSEYQAIENCIKETHGPSHTSYDIEVMEVFSCQKRNEWSCFLNSENKLLLWHGSRITNWVGILKGGLRIAPSEAPVSGYMFGKGIYFADVCSKSANYCCATKRKNEGLLLLCEVSVGSQYPLTEADENMPCNLPSNYNSVLGIGRIHPSDFQMSLLSSECKLPIGPLIENTNYEGSLQYNEYIVYDVNQVKMKYLIKIKFNFK